MAQNTLPLNKLKKDDPRILFYRKVMSGPRHEEAEVLIHQGLYICNSAGKGYAAMPGHTPAKRVLRAMRKAKRRHSTLKIPKWNLGRANFSGYAKAPRDVVVLRVYGQDRESREPGDQDEAITGRDYMWVRLDEIEKLSRGEIPATFKGRLVCCSLYDITRTIPFRWEPHHVKKAVFHAKPSIRGQEVHIRLTGEFDMRAPEGSRKWNPGWPGVRWRGKLEGEIVYNRKTKKVSRFVMYAAGPAYGDPEGGLAHPGETFRLQLAFVLAKESDKTARAVPPHALTEIDMNPKRYLNSSIQDLKIDLEKYKSNDTHQCSRH